MEQPHYEELYGKLVGDEVVFCSSSEYTDWNNSNKGLRIVKQDFLPDGTKVSTVFLGLNHNWMDAGDPIWFETMIFFSAGEEEYQIRYHDIKKARKGHKRALKYARKKVASLSPIKSFLKL